MSSFGGTWDVFILKLDANGNFIWGRDPWGGSDDVGASIATDAAGNVYTTGRFVNTVDFDPGAGTFNLNSGGLYGSFILKLDAAGIFSWAAGLTGNSTGMPWRSIGAKRLRYRRVARFVRFRSRSGNADAFQRRRARHLCLETQFQRRTGVGQADGIYRHGPRQCDCRGCRQVRVCSRAICRNRYFDPGAGVANLVSAGGDEAFVFKLDELGNYVWAKRFAEALLTSSTA